MMELLQELILVSEKAANIARKCREDEHLFGLLVEEKKENEANPRFVQDFKTLADVLIQEIVKHDIGGKFIEMKENIFGEESNIFCNQLKETIRVEVLEDADKTAALLKKVLNGANEAAIVLAEEVHKQIEIKDVNTEILETLQFDDLNYDSLGIWVDPIDSTAEYINGGVNEDENGISIGGLKCVTVLIGVFDLKTGNPILGIVNQPFYQLADNKYCKQPKVFKIYQVFRRWHGKCFWGSSLNKNYSLNFNSSQENTNIICLSSSENQEVKEKLKAAGFSLVEAAGAGYKILTVISGLADAYLLTKNSTFKWDTCGPQAILNSLNGDIIIYDKAINQKKIQSVTYACKPNDCKEKLDHCCNQGGIIAFKDTKVLQKVIDVLLD